MGPLIDIRARDRVHALVREAHSAADVIVESGIPDAGPAGSAFLTPSLLKVRDRNCRICTEEIFGPVLTIDTFGDDEEALAIANGTRYGLAASVWSPDGTWVRRMARRLRAGTVWINSHGRFAPELEVGGYKESGIGRLFGQQGLDDFLQTKHISWPLPAP